MKILNGYSDLAPAFKSKEECVIKGIDWATRFVRPFRCHVVQVPACLVQRICTTTYSSIALPQHKFLVNSLPQHPFSSVPLTSLLRVPLGQLQPQFVVAVAPIAEVSNNPYYPNSGIISDHVITFSRITNVNYVDVNPVYDVVLDEGDTYILNNTVRVL
jgi:hypothetical protein